MEWLSVMIMVGYVVVSQAAYYEPTSMMQFTPLQANITIFMIIYPSESP